MWDWECSLSLHTYTGGQPFLLVCRVCNSIIISPTVLRTFTAFASKWNFHSYKFFASGHQDSVGVVSERCFPPREIRRVFLSGRVAHQETRIVNKEVLWLVQKIDTAPDSFHYVNLIYFSKQVTGIMHHFWTRWPSGLHGWLLRVWKQEAPAVTWVTQTAKS